jgi:hypothetical protein
LFVKKISLKRDDDAAKKQEAKEWLENRKNKRARKGPAGVAVDEAAESTANSQEVSQNPSGEKVAMAGEALGSRVGERVKKEEGVLEGVAKTFDEAAGAIPRDAEIPTRREGI